MSIPSGIGDRQKQSFVESGTGITARQVHVTGGTLASLTGVVGTVNVIAILGTITTIQAATVDMVKAGTLDMIKAGTVSTVVMQQAGTLDMLKAATVNMLKNGTLDMLSAGTVTTVGMVQAGTLDMVKAATVSMVTAGTIDTNKMLQDGTLSMVKAATVSMVTAGTITTVGMVQDGTLSMIKAATVSMLSAGTVTTVGMVQAGTLDMIKAGTIDKVTSGTISTVTNLAQIAGIAPTIIAGGNFGVRQTGGTTPDADAASNTLGYGHNQDGSLIHSWSMGHVFNGTTWDRARGGTLGLSVGGFSGTHITAAGTTAAIKTGTGLLHSVSINNPLAGTHTIIDGTAAGTGGTVAIILVAATDHPVTLMYDYNLANGLSVITGATTDITITYR